MTQPKRRRPIVFTIRFIGAILVVCVATLLIANVVASRKVSNVQQGWEEMLGSRAQILERYPSRDTNAAALELEELVLPLGIYITPRSVEGENRPSREQGADIAEVKRIRHEYTRPMLERAERGSQPPPQPILDYLERHAEDLGAVRRQLIDGDVPRWEQRIELMQDAPLPNLLGHIDLHKLLILDALVRIGAGDRTTALEDVEASWRLTHALRDDPILITQLIAMAATRMQAGALRQIDDVPPVWRERLLEHDFHDSLMTALQFEGWYWTEIGDSGELSRVGEIPQQVLTRVVRPYVEYCLSDLSDDFRRRLEDLQNVEAFCDADLAAGRVSVEIPVPGWNLVGDSMIPNLNGTLTRLARLELDLELTVRLIDLAAARRAGDGNWPETEWDEPSEACPDDRWRYDPTDDGALAVAFSRQISWGPDQRGAILPTHFTLR